MYSSKIISTGAYVPETIVTNDDMAKFVDTSDEWIRSRCGIGQRRFTATDNTSDLAAKAAMNILEKAGKDPAEIELLVLATVSGDYCTPSTACLVQAKIGAVNALCFDISAACSGFVYGLSVADKFIQTGVYKNALVLGAEVLSKHLDFTDRTTCVLFGDGSAGVLLERSEEKGILAEEMGSDGAKGLSLTSGGTFPSGEIAKVLGNAEAATEENDLYIHMDGKTIFDFATRRTPKCINALIEKTGVSIDDIKYVIPHQANSRIVEVIARKTKIPMEKFYLNILQYGNTSSASIPIALNEMNEKGLLSKGDKIILIGFGGGLTWGSMLIEL